MVFATRSQTSLFEPQSNVNVNGTTAGRTTSASSQSSRPASVESKSQSMLSQADGSFRSSDGSAHRQSRTSSQRHSPLTTDYGRRNEDGRPTRLKSQYPRTGGQRHVEYVLVASFHVDRGPIMEYQYPGAITGDEHMLAELMLPDQAHVRKQDWTVFFLHKDTSNDAAGGRTGSGEEEKKGGGGRNGAKENGSRPGLHEGDDPHGDADKDEEEEEEEDDDDDDDDDEEGEEEGREGDGQEADEEDGDDDDDSDEERSEGHPLVYVLNLVNTKPDPAVKRGWVVKAMAICTRHSFLHIYKPLLLLALEEYFKSPYPETLASLYDAVNSMDLSLMPRLSIFERYILQASDAKDLFLEKFEQMIQQRMAEEHAAPRETVEPAPASTVPDDDPNRTPTSQAMAMATGHGPPYALPRDTHEFETRVVYNHIPIPVKIPTALSPETVGGFSLIKLIQTFSGPHAKEAQPFMLHSHLSTSGAYTHPIVVLANAMLTQKRVIFLGHNLPSGEVAEAVLAACALASGGILRGFTRFAFPYTDLTKIEELLKVPGFVAGVTNPAFANHPEWWDLLCDLQTGRMKISHRIEPAPITDAFINFQQQPAHAAAGPAGPAGPTPPPPPSSSSSSSSSSHASGAVSALDPTGDQAFMEDVMRSIGLRHGEAVIRAKWRDWIVKFTRVAAAFEESVYGASALYAGEAEGDDAAHAVLAGHGFVWSDEGSRQRELTGSVHRIEGWRNTRSYYSFIQDLARLYAIRPIKSLDLHHLHDRLRTQKLSPAESAAIYTAFGARVHSYPEICQLLTVTPEAHAGLFYLSLGLFHPRPDVQAATFRLLARIRAHMAGRHFWNGLHRFAKLAYLRQQDAELRRCQDPAEAGALMAMEAGVHGEGRGGSGHS
ncbi:MAG: hypothetical protein M1826_002949 [Phylliscum demangeonii]|nr:MAG: hypothetical protein M1826_002949 [Phylliscum demangeonii]